MKKKHIIFILISMLILFAGFSKPAAAGDMEGPPGGYFCPGYVDAPDWSADTGYTRQSWDFLPVPDLDEPGTYKEPAFINDDAPILYPNPVTPPVSPDADTYGGPGMYNSYGSPSFYASGRTTSFAWEWTDYGMGMENNTFYGHIGGMGAGYVAFELPSLEIANATKEIWIQYIVYLHKNDTPADMVTGFFSDSDMSAEIGAMESRLWEQLDGPGGTGYWWRITENWTMPQSDKDFFRLETADGTATLIDTIDIQTRCKTVFTPEFDPVSGTTFTSPLAVSISCATNGAIIYYTIDGTEPTLSSNEYTEAISISESTTFKARAFKNGMEQSAVATATYTKADTVVEPVFLPVSGSTFTSSLAVSISCATNGAIIYYTIDGTEPTLSSNEYTEAISISESTTFKARAFKDGMEQSSIADAAYTRAFPEIAYSSPVFNFNAIENDNNPDAQILEIWNSGSGILNWSVSDNVDWLSLTPESGSSTSEDNKGAVTLSVDITGLNPGDYEAKLIISDPEAKKPSVSLCVNLSISAEPEVPNIAYSSLEYIFSAAQSGNDPADNSLWIWNSGTGTLNWSVSDNVDWLSLTPESGSSTSEDDKEAVTLSVDITGLDAGNYDAAITISDPEAANNQQTINIRLTIISSEWSDNPYYTHQSWEFNSLDIDPDTPGWQLPTCNDAGKDDAISPGIPGREDDEGNPYAPLAPDALDDEFQNNYGEPLLIYAMPRDNESGGWSWHAMAGPWFRCGYYGGMGDTALVFEIPNYYQAEQMHTQVKIEWFFFGSDNGLDWRCEIGRNYEKNLDESNHLDRIIITNTNGVNLLNETVVEIPDTVNPNGKIWHRITQLWEFDDSPAKIYAKIYGLSNVAVLIDQVEINARSLNYISPPEVVSTIPMPGENDARVNSPIFITFNRPMDKAATEAAFSISPEIEGSFTWSALDKNLTFNPEYYLSCGDEYTVTVSKDAKDVSEVNLVEDYTFSFTTENYTDPAAEFENIPEGTVEHPETTGNVAIKLSGDGIYRYRYKLDDNEWTQAFAINETLVILNLDDEEHSIEIEVEDAEMTWHAAGQINWLVMVPPTVVSTLPGDGSTAPTNTTISITFSEIVAADSAESAFSINPVAAGSFDWSDPGKTMIFTPDYELDKNITYTVTIANSVCDLAGNTLVDSHIFSFIIADVIICPDIADTYILFGGMGGGKGYPKSTSQGHPLLKAGAVSIVDARALIKFDLSSLSDIHPDEIISAKFHYQMKAPPGDDMDVNGPAPADVPMYGFIYALDTMTYEYTALYEGIWQEAGKTDPPLPHPLEPFFWTEGEYYEAGYAWAVNKPGYAPGAPMIFAAHNTGPNTQGSIDITKIVKGWIIGRFSNNGIELKDHDDRSDTGSAYGDGYSWFLASREDSYGAPYLAVQVHVNDRVRIINKPVTLPAVLYGENRTFKAEGGDSSNYNWRVYGPKGDDLTDQILSTTEGGGSTIFTAPGTGAGLYKIIISDGIKSDSLLIGVTDSDAYIPNDDLYGLSQQSFPLFMGQEINTIGQQIIYQVCEKTVADLGISGMLGKITLITETGVQQIGGTGLPDAAKTSISIIENPSAGSPVVSVTDENNNFLCAIEFGAGDIEAGAGRIYIAATDSGIPSWDNASNVYNFAVFNENGEKTDNSLINNIVITLSFNKALIQSDQLRNGGYSIIYAENTGLFFTAEENHPEQKGSIEIDNIIDVNYNEGWIKFRADHLTSFGVRGSGNESGEFSSEKKQPKLDSGCFIITADSYSKADSLKAGIGFLVMALFFALFTIFFHSVFFILKNN